MYILIIKNNSYIFIYFELIIFLEQELHLIDRIVLPFIGFCLDYQV